MGGIKRFNFGLKHPSLERAGDNDCIISMYIYLGLVESSWLDCPPACHMLSSRPLFQHPRRAETFDNKRLSWNLWPEDWPVGFQCFLDFCQSTNLSKLRLHFMNLNKVKPSLWHWILDKSFSPGICISYIVHYYFWCHHIRWPGGGIFHIVQCHVFR